MEDQNKNYMDITQTSYTGSFVNLSDCPPADKPEYAFIGRSNVGKSSLINMLTSRKKLAHVSNSPGKTQTINYFLINNSWNLVDLPGYGFAKVSRKQRSSWSKMINSYIKNRENLVCLFVLIDSRHKPQKTDLQFIDQLGQWEIPFVIIFTKTDKIKQQIVQKNVKLFFSEMRKEWEFLPPYFLSSAIKGLGKKDILEYINEYNIRFGAIARSSHL